MARRTKRRCNRKRHSRRVRRRQGGGGWLDFITGATKTDEKTNPTAAPVAPAAGAAGVAVNNPDPVAVAAAGPQAGGSRRHRCKYCKCKRCRCTSHSRR